MYRSRLFVMNILNKIYQSIRKNKSIFAVVLGIGAYCVISYLFNIPCPIKTITGISCPGCGMSRACISLLKLDIQSAAHYHPLVFGILPIGACFIVFYARKAYKARKYFIIFVTILFFTVYFYRMFISHSPVLECNIENSIFVKLFNLIVNRA